MEYSKITVFIVTILISIAMCHRHHEAWRRHTAAVSSFKCNTPQPRTMELSEFFEETLLYSARTIIPASTVLHRCGSSGCCPTNKTCLPVKTEEVKLVFLVVEGPKKNKYVEVTAKNHTSCACHHHSNNPK